MKTKLSLIVAIAITTLNAEVITTHVFTNPLGSNFKSTDNGGTLPAIDAYKDGIGVIVLDNIGQNIQIDNSAMNTLVYKYGEEAKANNTTIVDEVMYGSGSTSTKDKVLVGNLTVDGAACNDQNAATQGETWLNGNCQGGINTNGTPCNDGDPKTISDIYTNGVCAGTNVEGQACSDDNFLTIQDKYIDGVCVGTLTANGQSCNDNNVMTINDIYTNGVCAGTLTVNGQSCNDGHVMTVNDVYTNGVCAGTLTVNGTACNDGNAATNGETWLNGVCQGGMLAAITNPAALPSSAKATYTLTPSMTCIFGNPTSVLFNGVTVGYEPQSFYAGNSQYVDITVTSNFRVWTYVDYAAWQTASASLEFKNVATGLFVNNTVSSTGRLAGVWTLSSSVMPAGRYHVTPSATKFDAAGNYGASARIDSEWFLEKVN